MILPLEAQLQGFLLAAIAGIFLGILYDLFRIFRVLMQSPASQVFWCDMFYMTFAALVTFILCVGVSSGEVRYYILVGEAAGFCLYFFTLGMISVRIARLVKKLLDICIFDPLSKITSRISAKFTEKKKKFSEYLKKTFRKPKKRLKRHKHLVYNNPIDSKKRKRGSKERQR